MKTGAFLGSSFLIHKGKSLSELNGNSAFLFPVFVYSCKLAFWVGFFLFCFCLFWIFSVYFNVRLMVSSFSVLKMEHRYIHYSSVSNGGKENFAMLDVSVFLQVAAKRPGSLKKVAQQFLLMWSCFGTRVIRDMTLHSAPSFGTFSTFILLYYLHDTDQKRLHGW